MSGELFVLITANFNFFIVYLESHVTPKRTVRKQGVEGSFLRLVEIEIVELKVDKKKVFWRRATRQRKREYEKRAGIEGKNG